MAIAEKNKWVKTLRVGENNGGKPTVFIFGWYYYFYGNISRLKSIHFYEVN